MKHYDHIVVGSGISGLTLALLLARQGRSVLLLEKASKIGGAVARFRRHGVPFDVGFHFTGGLCPGGDGIFDDMLSVLELDAAVQPEIVSDEACHCIVFPDLGATHKVACGIDRYRRQLHREFPGCRTGIDRYFDRFLLVCRETPSMDIRNMSDAPPEPLEEDFITLQAVLDELFDDPLLKTVLSVFCMCHGTRPEEISFANHCRIAFALYESTARVRNGGDAFVDAFAAAFQPLDVEIRCNTWVQELADVSGRRVQRFVLSDGEEVVADSCVFTTHPRSILEVLNTTKVSRAFQHRVESFEPSAGFFSVFGTVDDSVRDVVGTTIFSVFPGVDLNLVMNPEWTGDRPVVMLCGDSGTGADGITTATAFELSLPEELAAWNGTRTGRRGPGYTEYKRCKSEAIIRRLSEHLPAFAQGFTLYDSASMLTFRDYLNSPYGSAYGIKQKLGQFNLVGRLPLSNLYAAGQSAILPGVVGAMASGFFVTRAMIGRDEFQRYIGGKLCHT